MTKIHVGIARKIGQPHFGSVGAECHLEIEIDGSLLRSPDESLPHRIQEAFNVCRREVDRELRSGTAIESNATSANVALPTRSHSPANGIAAHPPLPNQRARPATDAQIRAIHAIASKANVRLASEIAEQFGVDSPRSLTLRQASDFIEKLKCLLPAS